jgi:hypothetical protein
MSTNYYAHGPFPGGDPDSEGLHIGQHAAGWRFLFHAHASLGLTTLDDWLTFLNREGVTIHDEYGSEISIDEMTATMTQTRGAEGHPLRERGRTSDEHHYVAPGGHAFSRRDFF